MVHDDDNNEQDDGGTEAPWLAWQRAWTELLVLTGAPDGAVSRWPELTEAVWRLFQEDSGDIELVRQLRAVAHAWCTSLEAVMPTSERIAASIRSLFNLREMTAPWVPATSIPSAWPHLGPLQHDQARWEAVMRAAIRYQEAAQDYLAELATLVERCITAFERALRENEALDRSDPRALMTVWNEVAEREYEARLRTEEYGDALTALTDGWTELRHALQPIIDDALEALGMPSRRALNDTQSAVHRLQQRHREETRALRQRIERLEERLPVSNPGPGGQT